MKLLVILFILKKLFLVQKVACITAMADKKIRTVFCSSGGFCSPNLSLLFKLYTFFSLALFSSGIHNGREKS